MLFFFYWSMSLIILDWNIFCWMYSLTKWKWEIQKRESKINLKYFSGCEIRDKVFKNGPRKICGWQPLKIFKEYGLLSRPYSFKAFKGCLPQILLGPFLNTFSHMFLSFVDFPSQNIQHRNFSYSDNTETLISANWEKLETLFLQLNGFSS